MSILGSADTACFVTSSSNLYHVLFVKVGQLAILLRTFVLLSSAFQ